MALRDQPYLPLYIQDIMTDEKLNECSAATHGIYIKGIMCLMHKSEEYGKILLKEKYKQSKSIYSNFALQLSKNLLYTLPEIEKAIKELIEEGVCYFESETLCQKRMIKDNDISLKRSNSGKQGGQKTQSKAKNFDKPKKEANTENAYENENEINKEKGSTFFKKTRLTKNKFIPPTLEEVKEYFKEKGYTENTAVQAWEGYNVNNWKDSNDKPIKNWKMKMIQVWFKEENQINGKPKHHQANTESRKSLRQEAIEQLTNATRGGDQVQGTGDE